MSNELHRRAVERLFRTDKRRVSLVDVVSFVVMEAEGLTDVLGLDIRRPALKLPGMGRLGIPIAE